LIAFDPLALDRDIFGRTPLHYACLSDNICEVVRLMAAGINPNVADHNHSTPLRVAVRRGNLAALTCLLSHSELDLNPRGPNNLTPLSVAAKHGEITMARMLVARGARIDDVWGEGRTPLLIATEHRQYAMVKWLLSQPDINPNACRSDGVTSLLGTACAGWEAIAELFVDHPNIDVNATTANKNTALFYATRNGSRQLFKKLIAHRDIDLTIVGVGGTLLHAAVQHIDLLRILLTKRVIDVNAINCHGETALHRAATAGYDAAIAELLAVPEIDPNICTKRGDTALHRALAGRHSDVAERIVCFEKTDINKHTGNWASPLSLAIMWKMPTVAKILLQRSDIEIRGQVGVKNSWPPLTIAANYGNREIMELLLARPGVDLTDDKYGVKATFTITMKHGFTECVQLLQTIWKARRIPKKKQQKRSGFFKRFCRRKKTMNV
jgi:ankyrin repeat protein